MTALADGTAADGTAARGTVKQGAGPRIGYLLHRFPGNTDTFIKREILALRDAGLPVRVISVWQPKPHETTPANMEQWRDSTDMILPGSKLSLVSGVLSEAVSRPGTFLRAMHLAWKTARPGVKGLAMQGAYFVEAVAAARIARRHGMTHLHNHIGDQSGTVTMLAAAMAGIGYSITFHGWPVFVDAYATQVGEKCRRAVFTRSISHFCRSQLMFFSGARSPEGFEIVRCGLDLPHYTWRAPRGQTTKLLCVARMSFEKGIGFLVQAMAVMRDRGMQTTLRLAGDGPDRAALETMARDLGVADRVTFLGHVDEHAIQVELDGADAFVLPSFIEGVPVSAMEAMAVGVPVIATNVGGTGELVHHGETGLLIRPSDPDAIADAVRALQADPALAERMSRAGRAMVERDYDGAKEFATLHRLFTDYAALSDDTNGYAATRLARDA